MKKQLLFLGMAASIVSFNASAQLALENFDHSGAPPPGWTILNDANTVSSTFTHVSGLPASLTAAGWVPISGTYTGYGGATNYQMITTSDFTPTGTADRWLITPSFPIPAGVDSMVIQWDDNDLGSGETIDLKVSPTAGNTRAAFTSSIYSAPAGTNGLTTHQALVGTWAGSNITIAFHDGTTNNWGLLVDNVMTATLPHIDLGVTSLYLPPFGQAGLSYPITGVLHNFGVSTVTSLNLNYSVNGGAPVTTPLASLSIPLNTDYTYTSGTPWVPATAGTYTIKVWADNINGVPDRNNANDTFVTTMIIVSALQPKLVLIEEFNQASCDPCAAATPNLDTVYVNNIARSIMVRYHVNFPGRDCMDSVTLAPFVSHRLTYYGVNGVPDAQVDGQYVYPGAAGPGSFSTTVMDKYAGVGSPMSVNVAAGFNWVTQTYTFTATIKSFGIIPAGLKAYAALTVDTLTYANNQSTESIPQTEFPEVAENMFPTYAGTTLAAFTSGSTQTVSGTWVKNHPWASDYAVWKYDSSLNGKIVVWVENDAEKYVYQAGYAVVKVQYQKNLGVDAVTGSNGSMNLFPNPATNTTTIGLELTTGADVKVEVYNVTGQLVYSVPAEHRNAGSSISHIDVSNFANGTYIVKTSIGAEVLTKTLTIAK